MATRKIQQQLNRGHYLNTKLIYDRLDTMGKCPKWFAEQVGSHRSSVRNFLKEQRVPVDVIFDRIPGVLGVSREDLLLVKEEANHAR